MNNKPSDPDVELKQWLAEQDDSGALASVVEQLQAHAAGSAAGRGADGFKQRVLKRAIAAQGRPAKMRRFLPLAAAACLLLGGASIGFFVGLPTPPGQLAWGDVVSAMQPVKQIHVSIFQTKWPGLDLEHFDLYYQNPEQWRAQGENRVQFSAGTNSRLYNATAGKFVTPDQVFPSLVHPEFADAVQRDGPLEAIVKNMFRAEASSRVVVNDPALRQVGIQVFDYKSEANGGIVGRIWVLEQSRLPIRFQVEYAIGPKVWANIDYAEPAHDPQFFDGSFFEEKIKANGTPSTRNAFANHFNIDDITAWHKLALQWREPVGTLQYSENPADANLPGMTHSTYTFQDRKIDRYEHNGPADKLPAFHANGEKVLSDGWTMVFIHERSTAGPNPVKCLVSVGSPGFEGNSLGLQTFQYGPDGMPRLGMARRIDMTGICKPGEIRIFAGQPDDKDPSHFTIPIEANGKNGTIDGYFRQTNGDAFPDFEFTFHMDNNAP